MRLLGGSTLQSKDLHKHSRPNPSSLHASVAFSKQSEEEMPSLIGLMVILGYPSGVGQDLSCDNISTTSEGSCQLVGTGSLLVKD